MSDPAIDSLAQSLGIRAQCPIQGIIEYCLTTVTSWVQEAGQIENIGELESVVCRNLAMAIEEVATDSDFDMIAGKYNAQKQDPIFGVLQYLFLDTCTFGALIQRKVPSYDPCRVVAVIDARGAKAHRRFFTKWHEIAHRLTTHSELPEVVFRASDSPIENLMDDIASHLGFYQPLLNKALEKAGGHIHPLSFDITDRVRREFPTSSFQAALIASVRETPFPACYIELTQNKNHFVLNRALPNKLVHAPLDTSMWEGSDSFFGRLWKQPPQTKLQNHLGNTLIEGLKTPEKVYGIVSWGAAP